MSPHAKNCRKNGQGKAGISGIVANRAVEPHLCLFPMAADGLFVEFEQGRDFVVTRGRRKTAVSRSWPSGDPPLPVHQAPRAPAAACRPRGSAGHGHSSSRAVMAFPPPCFAAARRRAFSTSIRRIASDAAPKKWRRFCPCPFATHETKIRLVHQRGGLQRVIGTFARHPDRSHFTQLRVDRCQQVGRSGIIAQCHRIEHAGDVVHFRKISIGRGCEKVQSRHRGAARPGPKSGENNR